MKDKITIGYMLVIVTILAVVTLYFAKLDFTDMNSNIQASSVKAYKTGKDYSSKLYKLAVSSMHLEDDVNETVVQKKEEITKAKAFAVKKVKVKVKVNKDLKDPVVLKQKVIKKIKAKVAVKDKFTVKPNNSVSKSIQIKGNQ